MEILGYRVSGLPFLATAGEASSAKISWACLVGHCADKTESLINFCMEKRKKVKKNKIEILQCVKSWR